MTAHWQRAWRFAQSVAKTDVFLAAVAYNCILLVFFSTPILGYNDLYYSAGDITQAFPLTTVEPGYVFKNGIMGDPFACFEPWYHFNAECVCQGHVPLWNPYNSCGLPHMANSQSAVFSPYTFPFYIFNAKTALILTSYMKVFFAGFFLFLFLKLIGLRFLTALIGGAIFMFSGYGMVWLLWPQAATQTALPATLVCLEVAFQRFENPDIRRPLYWPFCGVAISLAIGVFDGHIETFLFSLFVISGYALFRLYGIYIHISASRFGRFALLRFSITLLLVGVAGALLAAIQIGPFLEYLMNSNTLHERQESSIVILQDFRSVVGYARLFFPDLLGSPSSQFQLPGFPQPNYNEATGTHIGAFPLFLALGSLLFVFADRRIRFFAGTTAIWMIFVENLFGGQLLMRHIPAISLAPIVRSQAVWCLATSCCAALCLENLLKTKRKMLLFQSFVTFLAGMVFFSIGIACAIYAIRLIEEQLISMPTHFLRFVGMHMIIIAASFLLGLIGLIMSRLSRNPREQNCFLWFVLIGILSQNALVFKDYGGSIPNSVHYPNNETMTKLQNLSGKQYVAVGGGLMAPNTNLFYKLHVLQSIDALWVRNFDRLYRDFFHAEGGYRFITKVDTKSLYLFGVDWLISPRDIFDTSEINTRQRVGQKVYNLGELIAGTKVEQRFNSDSNRLIGIDLDFGTFGRENICNVDVTVRDGTSRDILFNRRFSASALPNNQFFPVAFKEQANSKDKAYILEVESPDGRPGSAVTLWAKGDTQIPGGSLAIGGAKAEGNLFFSVEFANDELVREEDYGPNVLFRVAKSPSKYHFVDHIIVASSDEDAFAKIKSPEFDPRMAAVIGPAGAPANPQPELPASASRIQVVEELNASTRLIVNRVQPGYLILNRTYYPGWKALVNGVNTPLSQANYAFFALPVGAGQSEIIFYYDPMSFKLGALISFCTIAAMALLSQRGQRNIHLLFDRIRKARANKVVK